MRFSPIEASREIATKYVRYLSTIFNISDEKYAAQFQEQINDQKLFSAGPYLDVTESFEKGKSIDALIHEGVLSCGFSSIGMPADRPLYKHQEIALRKINQGKNVVVSTGTGSGKTECFLIPILNDLISLHEAGQLGPGVRAMLIYPMNALANDQVERLRSLLKNTPYITYGAYTGQTKHRYMEALADYRILNEGKDPAPNELISRDQMKATPPNILITNYAMLEYLMVRPADTVFFDGNYGQYWKYIVLDEAHVYSGSTGIEVSMLLKRLQARLNNKHIQYILTSATLGDEDSNSEVTTFAGSLCSSTFSTTDVIRAYRNKPEHLAAPTTLPMRFYHEIADAISIEKSEQEIVRIIQTYIPGKREGSAEEFLYTVIRDDSLYRRIRAMLAQPKTVDEICATIGLSNEELVDFVIAAAACSLDGGRLFDARYHFFLRASESVFITLPPSGKLFLNRKKTHYEADGTDYKVFEIATCSSCHCMYLTGKILGDNLEQSSVGEDEENTALFLLNDTVSDSDEEHTLETENIQIEDWKICSRCGRVTQKGSKRQCGHGSKYLMDVKRVRVNTPSRVLTKCPHCEMTKGTGILRRFFTGQEAVTSVIGTALFEAMPSYKVVHEIGHPNDDFGFDFDDGPSTEDGKEYKEKIAKQFLAFSDSRQGAAFYATYLDQTYRNILYKRVFLEAIKNVHGQQTIDTFVNNLAGVMDQYDIAKGDSEREAWKAVLAEVTDNNGATSLYNLGFIKFGTTITNFPALSKFKLSSEDVENICNVFLLGMMTDAAIRYPYSMSKADREFFTHNGVEYAYTLSDSNEKSYKHAFIPTKQNLSNKRLDYLTRVLERRGITVVKDDLLRVLENFWNLLQKRFNLMVPDGNGGFRIDVQKVTVQKTRTHYYCSKCKKITAYNVGGVCPSYQCDGGLKEVNVETLLSGNHYYELYQTLDIRELRIVEHTAQLSKETAYEYQRKFKQKELDVLSCSTTFEMGVDVGSLETVFMRNMPPSPANYAQRAGRAGRSQKAAAYALTFCTKSNHDFSFFKTPERMIKGKINPPLFKVENEKIAIRHLYASTFGFFWRQYPQYFSTIGEMIDVGADGTSGLSLFLDYLASKPSDLQAYLMHFLPVSLTKRFGIADFEWIQSLWNESEENPGVLTRAVSEYNDEVAKLEEAINTADRYARTDSLKERVRRFKKENILEFLSRKNVMPKYGFPVDTVEMSILDRSGKQKLGLQLQRDLSMAISEYAPGSQVVANGNLITSRYVKKVPRLGWKIYDYKQCPDCRTLNITVHIKDSEGVADNGELDYCKQCKKRLDVSSQAFIIPEFGFEADKIEKPGLRKPERTYRGDISYIGYKEQIEFQEMQIGMAVIEIGTSPNDEMAVLNENNFYICSVCGYTDQDEKCFSYTKKIKHKNIAGYPCVSDTMRKYALGYRFHTDVTQIRFIDPEIRTVEEALSILYGVIKGVCSYLNIEERDISGCIHYFYNPVSSMPNYSLILYDATPGGAGHVKRITEEAAFVSILRETLRLMQQCDCGGESMDTSCYSCLRSYRNQKFHDILQRGYVVRFLNHILS